MYKSHFLSTAEFHRFSQGASILEQDERGIKVLMLDNGDILKVFRVRNRFSAARIYSYARRFCRNAARLHRLGIPTIQIKQLFHLAAPAQTAVLYTPLAGDTLRELLDKRSLTSNEARKLGIFIAGLHKQGVHFRSLHLGNTVLNPQGELGLIDIADMSIYPWGLWCSTRARSFSHLHRYPEQIRQLGQETWQHIETSYFSHALLAGACEKKLRQHLSKISVFA
jgi:tRNA A-37 threonylcarbamoyl transferase component Bud32